MPAVGAPDAQSQHDVAHVAHGAITTSRLKSFWAIAANAAVNHAEHADGADEITQLISAVGTNRKTNTYDPVSAHFQQHPGKDHRDRRGGFDMRIRQPCMQAATAGTLIANPMNSSKKAHHRCSFPTAILG